MDLITAAAAFDKLELTDLVTGGVIGLCQFDLFDDSKREGLSASRRIVAMRPEVADMVPTHRMVKVDGMVWLLAEPHHDYWFQRRIRTKFVAMELDQPLKVSTAQQLLQGTPPRQALCNLVWNKNARRDAVTDGSFPVYTAFLSAGEAPDTRDYVQVGSDVFRVRAAYISPGGAHAVELVPLPYGGPKLVNYRPKSGAFNPVEGRHVGAAPRTVSALVADWFDVYSIQHTEQAGKRGDLSVVLLPDGQAAGDELDIDGQAYRVIFVQERDGVALLRVRI